MVLFGLYKTKKERAIEEEQRRASELEQKLTTQKSLGEELTRALVQGASSNTVYNVMPDGTKFEEATVHGFHTGKKIGPVTVESLPNNGGDYSVCVGVPDPTVFTQFSPRHGGYPILQADVNMRRAGKELHVHYGAYGADEYHPITSFAQVKADLARRVEEFTLFPK